MKVTSFVFLFVAIAMCSATETTTEPPALCNIVCPKPPTKDVILLPSPERCEDYCQCDPRGAILHHCPPYNAAGDRLYFNPEIKVCDWPDNVNCTN